MAGQNERRIPWGIQYARVLLHVQEVCWGIVSAFCLFGLLLGAANGDDADTAVVGIVLLAGGAAAGAVVGKHHLARHLIVGDRGARKVAIRAEVAMTCLGTLGSALIGTSIALLAVPMLVGAALSLVAVTGLLRPPARGYCENGSLASPGGGPVPGGTRPTLFWRLRVAAG
jgi:hypothetical protein